MRTINLKRTMSAPNSPKTKRGANGKFLPKSRIFSCWKIPLPRLAPVLRPCEASLLTLLFQLRHPNSKTNEPKFWQNPLLTEAVHLSHFEYKMLKVLRKCPTLSHPKKLLCQNFVRIESRQFLLSRRNPSLDTPPPYRKSKRKSR